MRYFTPQEANTFVPALREAFGKIDSDRVELVELLQELAALGHEVDLDAEVPEDLPAPVRGRSLKAQALLRRIRGVVGELQAHGLLVTRIDGLVDFVARRGNRPVLLCWRKGEDRIEHWHELGSSAEARRPIDQLFTPTLPN